MSHQNTKRYINVIHFIVTFEEVTLKTSLVVAAMSYVRRVHTTCVHGPAVI